MAYKFQRGKAIMSGTLTQEGGFVAVSDGSDSSNNFSGSGDLTIAGGWVIKDTYQCTKAGVLSIASMGMNWTNAGRTVADGGILTIVTGSNVKITTINCDGGAIDGTIIGASSVAAGSFAAVVGTSANFSTTLNADGATTLNGAVTLGDAIGDDLVFTGLVASSFVPKTDSTYTLGTNLLQFSEAHIDTGNIDEVIAQKLTSSFGLESSGGNISGSDGLNIHGSKVNMPNLADGALSAAKTIVWSDGGLLKTESINDVAGLMAGAVATTMLSDSGATIKLDFANGDSQEAVPTTSDLLVFYNDNLLKNKKITGVAFLSGSLSLLAEASIAVADDYITFLDGGATGLAKKEKWADVVSAIAGSGITATNGVLSTDGGGTPSNTVDGGTLTEGYNYMSGTSRSNCILPNEPSVGDVIYLKVGNLAKGETVSITVNSGWERTMDGDTVQLIESAYAALSFVYMVSGSWSII